MNMNILGWFYIASEAEAVRSVSRINKKGWPFTRHFLFPSSLLPSLPSLYSLPIPFPLEVGYPQSSWKVWERCKLLQRVRAEPGRQMTFGTF